MGSLTAQTHGQTAALVTYAAQSERTSKLLVTYTCVLADKQTDQKETDLQGSTHLDAGRCTH